jgi:hypothetical protein
MSSGVATNGRLVGVTPYEPTEGQGGLGRIAQALCDHRRPQGQDGGAVDATWSLMDAPRANAWRGPSKSCAALPESDVRGYQHRTASLVLPDAGDRQLLAAAIEAGASILLTFNLADFQSASLPPQGVAARHPDDFLCELHAADPEAVEAAVNLVRENLTVTAPTTGDFLEALERQRLVRFATRIIR